MNGQDIQGLTSLGQLLNMGIAATMVVWITQYFKSVLRGKINLRVFVWILALLTQVVAVFFTEAGLENFVLGFFNSFVVAFTAMGMYEAIPIPDLE